MSPYLLMVHSDGWPGAQSRSESFCPVPAGITSWVFHYITQESHWG